MQKKTLYKVVAVSLVLLTQGGCADLVRKRADEQIAAGDYEQAAVIYRRGLERYPDSPTLRAGQVSATQEVANRLLAQAATARSAGNEAEADTALQRLLKLDPSNLRAKALLLDLARDNRQREELGKARKLIDTKQYDAAQAVVEAALKDHPRNPELLAFQRRLELELRSQGSSPGVMRLADTRPITLEFRDANLRMLLEAISRSTGVDFIVDKDVRPDLRVTIFLRGSRLEDALELITSSNQLSKKVLDARTIMIYPNTPDKQRDYQDLLVRAFFLANSEAKQTAALLKSVLKLREPFVDEKLNLIVLRESPDVIRLAERLVALHDVGEPEVMLEVDVLEIRASRLYDLGIKFPDSFSLTALPPTGVAGLTLSNVEGLNSNRIGLGVGGISVNLKRDVGDLNTLANPRVRVRNREKAKILVGDKVPVITSTTGSQGFVGESVSYLDVGLKVDVEPQVSLDDEVNIKMSLEVSSLAREIRTATGGLAYQIGTRSASTVLRLKDGETQVLAGLISKEDRMSASRVPGLGDLPMLGRLFASQRDDSQRTEIVLSVTPHVLRNVRLPDVNMTEFWSGTEANVRLRPLTLAPREAPNANETGPPVGGQTTGASLGRPPLPAPTKTTGESQAPASPSIAWVSLKATTTEVKTGGALNVEVNLKTATALRGLPVQLQFDTDMLELIEVTEGAFFKQGDAKVSLSRSESKDKGAASFGIIRATADGASGEGTVATLQFKAKKPGSAEIKLHSANPISLGQPIVPQLSAPLQVTIK